MIPAADTLIEYTDGIKAPDNAKQKSHDYQYTCIVCIVECCFNVNNENRDGEYCGFLDQGKLSNFKQKWASYKLIIPEGLFSIENIRNNMLVPINAMANTIIKYHKSKKYLLHRPILENLITDRMTDKLAEPRFENKPFYHEDLVTAGLWQKAEY